MEVDPMSSDDHATQIQGCIDRLRSGDQSARDELLVHASDRLTRLTRKMLRDFPGVHRWEQTDDVLQNAALRLCRAWARSSRRRPPTSSGWRRRRSAASCSTWPGATPAPTAWVPHHASVAGADQASAAAAGLNPTDTTHDPDRLAAWTDFHREVEALPAEEREAFDLLFYQGLSQAEAAAVLDVSERTIKRRWQTGAAAVGPDPGRKDARLLSLTLDGEMTMTA